MRHLAQVQPNSAYGHAAGDALTHFCTNCASLFDEPAARRRVCPRCGLGVVLTCSSATLDAPGAAFFVVTSDLRVSAGSKQAEDLFSVHDGTFGRPLLSLVTSPDSVGELARLVVAAANGTMAPSTIEVESAASKLDDISLEARIGGCGNPPAALVVVEPASR
jgi:predicted  nucleic acid-binding Zn-ribbon protein